MGKHSKKKDKKPSQADLADRHALYQDSVQCVEAEIDFVDDTFKAIRGRRAKLLREDFCGTANTSCEWVKRRDDNIAIGVDIDHEVLSWGKIHNVDALTEEQQSRIELIEDDVFKVETRPVEIILAMNFSYWFFKDRDTLRSYFKRAYDALQNDGVMFLDAFGGYEAFRLLEESTEYDDFTYTWDQDYYNPINGDLICHIHFEFPDGSEMRKAFTYTWRLWTLPEIQELLQEAGFKKVTIYWEGSDEDSEEGNGVFEPAQEGEADAGWIVYISAEK